MANNNLSEPMAFPDGREGRLPLDSIGVVQTGLLLTEPGSVSLPFDDVSSKYGYPSLYFRKTSRRISRSSYELQEEVLRFKQRLLQVESSPLSHLCGTYDKEVVLPTTCGLSFVRPHHFDLDEKGEFGRHRSFLFDDELIQHLLTKYRADANEIRDELRGILSYSAPISMKRGTNLGWPTQKSNSSRLERDLLLLGHIALVMGGRSRGYRLSDLRAQLESWHGRSYAVAGERLQHTDRVVPFYTADGRGLTYHLQPRVRGIYFSPKYEVAWNRRVVKAFLKLLMRSPHHLQDRSALGKWFSRFRPDEYLVLAIDVSRFDQSIGGECGRQMLRLIAKVIGTSPTEADDIFRDLDTEFSEPCLLRTSRSLYMTKGAEILSSGLSSTSLIGSLYSELLGLFLGRMIYGSMAASTSTLHREWDFLSWGDDMVFAISRTAFQRTFISHGCTDTASLLTKFSEAVDLKFDEEPTVKFLGQNYDMKSYSDSSTAYPLGRFIQQQFFPERPKDGPAAIIGLVARVALLDSAIAQEAFVNTLPLVADVIPPFRWNDRYRVVARAVAELSQDSQKISQVDDVLNLFTHGLQADDLDLSASGGLFPDEESSAAFSALLGLSNLEVRDVGRTFDSFGVSDSRLRAILISISRGNLIEWQRFLTLLQQRFGGSLQPGDAYY